MPERPLPSPEQVRAARAWLGLTQDELVAAANARAPGAGFSKRTLIRLEAGGTQTYDDTLARCRDVLEALGVEFLFDAGRASGIRVPRRHHAPGQTGPAGSVGAPALPIRRGGTRA